MVTFSDENAEEESGYYQHHKIVHGDPSNFYERLFKQMSLASLRCSPGRQRGLTGFSGVTFTVQDAEVESNYYQGQTAVSGYPSNFYERPSKQKSLVPMTIVPEGHRLD